MKRLLILGFFGVLLIFSLTTLAWVPHRLNYQGRLTDDTGSPITTTTTLRFSLYQGGDFTTPGSGTLVYEEDATVTPDSNGVFDHTIGSGSVVYGTLDATVFQTTSPVFLEITVDPAGLSETLLPRKQIVTVGYSFKSELADDADTVDTKHATDFAPAVHPHDASDIVSGKLNNARLNMGHGNGIDADMVDGQQASEFAPVDHPHDASDIVSGKLNNARLNMGHGNGIDADKVDGKHASDFYTKSESDSRFVNASGDDMTGSLSIDDGTLVVNGTIISDTKGWDWAVYAVADATSGTNYGVYGRSYSTSGYGVYGYASATSGSNIGVYGESKSPSGHGVYGEANATSGTPTGVFGGTTSPNGYAVFGWATATYGTNYGVYARSDSSSGYGIYGYNSAGGWAGYFLGKVHVQGQFTTSGSKPCVQPIDNGKKVLLYAMESPEIWFEDFGTGQLVNGQAVVRIERVFAQTANIESGYLVFLTPNGECQGLYISRKDRDSFEVRELGGGTSSITFDYRIVAKRRGYEDVRFEEFTEPEKSPAEVKLPIERKAATVKQRR